MHIHTATVPFTIIKIISKLDKNGEKEPKVPYFCQSDGQYIAKIKPDTPTCIEKFDVLPSLASFSLREVKTVAVGKVNAIKPLKQITVKK